MNIFHGSVDKSYLPSVLYRAERSVGSRNNAYDDAFQEREVSFTKWDTSSDEAEDDTFLFNDNVGGDFRNIRPSESS